MSTGLQVGIDFGTSKSAIAWRNPKTGEVRLVKFGSDSSIPSIVYYGDDEVLVGAEAESILEEEAEGRNIVRTAKKDLATNLVYPLPHDPTPVSTTTLILKALLDRAAADPELAAHLGPTKRVVEATITHPATFTELEKDRLRQAGLAAGLTRVELRSEPLAAALAASAAIQKGLGRTVLVYDLGAGTFDLAVLTKDDKGLWKPTIGPSGLPVEPIGERIGGDDFDHLIYQHAENLAKEQFGAALSDLPGRSPRLLRDYRSRKENLSNPKLDGVDFSDYLRPGQRLKYVMTRTEFEGLIRAKLDETMAAVFRMLKLTDQAGTPVESCILIGGSSRIPLVGRLLGSHANVLSWNQRDYAVVLGACEPYAPPVEEPVTAPKVEEPVEEEEFDIAVMLDEATVDESIKPNIKEFVKVLKESQLKLPKQRRPIIVVAGKTGVGKSTTINRIFGRPVSDIGTDRRGTELPKRLLWQFRDDGTRKLESSSLLIVDLPGLGDSERDLELQVFRPRYREFARVGDCFLIIVQPPRPCEISVMDALRLLLSEGVNPSQIVFGVNLYPTLSYLFDPAKQRYVSDADYRAMSADQKGKVVKRAVAPEDFAYKLKGAEKEAEKALIESFLEKVHASLGGDHAARFTSDQVILYDAEKGWHIFELLEVIGPRLPLAVQAHFDRETRRVADAIIADYKAVKDAERALIDEEKRKEKEAWEKAQEATRKFEKEQIEAGARVKYEKEQAQLKELWRKQDLDDERKIEQFEERQKVHSNNVVSTVLKKVAEVTRDTHPVVSRFATTVATGVEKVVDFGKRGWKSLFG